jgi:four helix bundle protein
MEPTSSKRYDLEDRTLAFAQEVRRFVKRLPTTIANTEDIRQLVKSSGSVGANYNEANEALSRKDFVMRLRIARKEAKETRYWLRLVDCGEQDEVERQRELLISEVVELLKILSAILVKST